MATFQAQLPLELDGLESDNLQEDKENYNIERIKQLFADRKYAKCLRAIEVAPAYTNLIILKASCWTHLGINHAWARQLLTQVIAAKPKNPSAYFELGLNFYINGDFDEAVEPFKTAFKLSAQTMLRALVCFDNASILSTIFRNGEWSLRNELVFKFWNFLASLEFQAGNNKKAVEVLSLAAAIDVENPSVVRKAKALIDFWLKIKPENEDKKLTEVEALIKFDHLDKAADTMPDFKDSARCWYLKALLSYKRAELVKAVFYAAKCLELDPHMDAAAVIAEKADKMLHFLRLASQQIKLKNSICAISLLDAALRLDRSNLRILQVIYFQRAMAKHGAALKEEALCDYHQFKQLQEKTGWTVVEAVDME